MSAALKEKIPITIRPLTQEDVDSVMAIDARISGKNRALTFAAIPGNIMGGQLEISVVAESKGKVIGFLLGRLIESQHEPAPYGLADIALLQLIGVDPDYQRRGVGTALAEGFTKRCQQNGVKSMHIFVSWHDWWLLSFLRSQGFVRGEMAEFVKPI